MGNIAYTRATWLKAQAYKRKWDKYESNGGEMPERDLAMDTLRGVLAGKILVHNHCYRADEMAIMIDMAKEFGYKITRLPPRGREPTRSPTCCAQRHLRGDVGRLVRLQDGKL